MTNEDKKECIVCKDKDIIFMNIEDNNYYCFSCLVILLGAVRELGFRYKMKK